MRQEERDSKHAASDVGWQVGLARRCTTPESPVWLYGYAGKPRHRPFDGKLQDLHAKAMAIEDGRGYRAVLITVDLCVLRAREAAALFRRITERTGLPESQILLNLSHTHSGPLIGVPDLEWYPMPDEARALSAAYTERFYDLVADAAACALGDMKPARLYRGVGATDIARNRRQFDVQGNYSGMGPNPDLYTDPRVPVLRVDAPDGKLRALIFGLACHAVTLDAENLKLSGDYPGFAQQDIEARYPGVQAMFVQGCGADANSFPRGGPEQWEQARRHGAALAAEVARVADGNLVCISGPLRTELAWIDLPLRDLPYERLERMAKGPMWEAHNARRLLELLERGEAPPRHYAAPLAVWQFGSDLTLVGIPGKTTSGFVPLMEKALGSERLWVAGYCNQVFGYLPTAQIVEEGGYETFGLVADIGFFAAETQDAVAMAVQELAEKAGRPVSDDRQPVDKQAMGSGIYW